jgi:regulatory protein
MKIIQIVKKDDSKVFVILDNDQKLILSKDIVYQNGLRKSDELSDNKISQLLAEQKKHNIKLKALSLLKRRIHSRKELFTKLKRHFSEARLIEECLSDLEEKNLLDDNHFAELFVQEKIRLKKWSKSKLKSELFLRGIPKDIIEECLNKFFDSGLEKEKAFELAEKKLNQIKLRTNDKKVIYQKLFMFLQSKGYDYELISEIITDILKID